jgi:hypothetical protein
MTCVIVGETIRLHSITKVILPFVSDGGYQLAIVRENLVLFGTKSDIVAEALDPYLSNALPIIYLLGFEVEILDFFVGLRVKELLVCLHG